MNEPYLVVSNLSRWYQKGQVRIEALHQVNFTVEKGNFVSIVGRSGSGKSTLLNLLGGLDTASEGQILFGGMDLTGMKKRELSLHRRFRIGMIFQSFNLVPSLTARENVELAMVFADTGPRERKTRAQALLDQVGMGHRLEHRPTELSGGEAQRVAIARALANDPPVLLADEPTGNLDSRTASEIMALLRQLNQEKGKTILMVSHDTDWAKMAARHFIRLADGRLVTDTNDPNSLS